MERIKKYEPLWGAWKVKRKVDEGSFGAVYEVEKTVAGNTSCSAVKLISFNNSEMLRGIKMDETVSAEILETIKAETAKKNVREAALMDKLQGRANIVTIHDYEIYPNDKTTDVLIRMEYLANLGEFIQDNCVDTELVIKLGIDICRALEACEKEKIIHRDIKPANIFVNKDGYFKLGDFGLSRQMNKSASMSLRKSKGTPLYMAPEAFGWGQQVDNTSDLYSLGIVMYQLLNDGKIPFCTKENDFEEEDMAIGKRLDGEMIPPPAHENGKLWEIIQKACQYKKEDRYKSAEKMQKDLNKLMKMREIDGNEIKEEKAIFNRKLDSIPSALQTENSCSTMKVTSNTVPKISQDCKVGDTITFGSYPQDLDLAAGKKPIEWIIVKKDLGKILVLSKKALDLRPYHEKWEPITWKDSDIRRWLNDIFYKEAFNETEKEKIQMTHVKVRQECLHYGAPPAEDTFDKVFFLSGEEDIGLRGTDWYCEPTDYVRKRFIKDKEETHYISWWYGNSSNTSYYVPYVDEKGSSGFCYYDEDNCEYSEINESTITDMRGVRPVMWINIDLSERETKPAKQMKTLESIKSYNVGDSFQFGSYPQDKDMSAVKKPIEWIVLEKKDNKILVLSKYVLDSKEFQESFFNDQNVTWKDSDIRQWLNNDFYKEAFTAQESTKILNTLVKADDTINEVVSDNDANDRIFLLSSHELNNLQSWSRRSVKNLLSCEATDYAIAKENDWEGEASVTWWLRSPGNEDFDDHPIEYAFDGFIDEDGCNADLKNGIRPAMWLSWEE